MKRLLAIGLMAALALSACTSGGDDGGDAEPVVTGGGDAGVDEGSGAVDTCALLAPDEIEAAVGSAVEEGTPGSVIGSCEWRGRSDGTSVLVSFVAAAVRRICAEGLEADAANEPIDGFDDPAFWSFVPGEGGAGTLTVCTGDGQLIVTVTGATADEPDEGELLTAATDLTTAALARI